jgi:hypothetical protein
MKELGLQELLRYALSGGVGIVALRLMYPQSACLISGIDGASQVTLLLGAILVVGSLIYNLHRSVLFPPIFRWLGRKTLVNDKSAPIGNPWVPSPDEVAIDRWRWNLDITFRHRWAEWGAQTHFLYCGTWAVLLAFLVGLPKWGWPHCRAWMSLAAVPLFVAGLVNNHRLLYSMNAERALRHAEEAGIAGRHDHSTQQSEG